MLIILLIPLVAAWDPKCPSPCTCSVQFSRSLDADLRTVNCEHVGLNKIPTLPSDTQAVLLARNNLLSVPSDQRWPSGLLELDLSGNRLRSIGKRAPFGGLNQLQRLDLADNRLTQLSTSHFEELFSLETLVLARNKISAIDTKTFDKLRKLEVLNLEQNRLTYIPENLWHAQSNLYELNLARNHLSVIQQKSFQRLLSLLQLGLSDNRILQIHPLAFADLIRLEYLKLDGNRLSKIPRDAIRIGARSLKSISIDRNPIYRIQGGDFSEMYELRDISLSQMERLTIVEEGAFESFPELLVFQLHDNPHLTEFSPGAFLSAPPKVSHLLLHNNNLPVLSESLVKSLPQLEEISFYGNPVSCDCNARWIREIMEASRPVFREADRLTCNSPADHKFRTLSSIAPETMGTKCAPTMMNLASNRVKANIQDTVTLDCGAVGIPEPKVSWKVPPAGEYQLRNGGKTVVIPQASRFASGTYVCTVENSMGQVAMDIEVLISTPKVELVARDIGATSALIAWSHDGAEPRHLVAFPTFTPSVKTVSTVNSLMTSLILQDLLPGIEYKACLSPSSPTAPDPIYLDCVTFKTHGPDRLIRFLSRGHSVAIACSLVIIICVLTLCAITVVAVRMRYASKVVPYTHLNIEDALPVKPAFGV